MMELFLQSVFTDNLALAYFLGMCTFLAVSRRLEVAFVFDQTSPLWSIAKRAVRSGRIDPTAALEGTGHLEVDGERVASQSLPAGGALPTWEGLDVGRDLRLPVTTQYEAPFEFQGELDEVVYDLH